MIRLTLQEVANAIDGRLLNESFGDVVVTASVETDSRLVRQGSLFFAKPGEVTDGHLFVAGAGKSGAVGAVVEREVTDASEVPQILVADVVLALGKLAKFVLEQLRRETDLQVIGITGSNGTTTTTCARRCRTWRHSARSNPFPPSHNGRGTQTHPSMSFSLTVTAGGSVQSGSEA